MNLCRETVSQYTVYAIADPRDDAVRYIGVTTGSARQRYYCHTRCKRRIGQWMRAMREQGIKPELITLETGYGDPLKAERIQQHKHRMAGAQLLNSHLVLPILNDEQRHAWYERCHRIIDAHR